jgi:choline dehydrogenase
MRKRAPLAVPYCSSEREKIVQESFDFIIVGAGSAGAAIATRLTEDPGVSVLLLEAGGTDNHPLQVMPLAFLPVGDNPHYNWHFGSEPEQALHGRKIPIARGRTLGGTSSINALIAIRGNPRDFDIWRESGLEGWGYTDVLPYFKRLETHWRGETNYHGGSGPVKITRMENPSLNFKAVAEAAQAAGYKLNDDPNGPTQDGICQMEATIDRGSRSSTARGYLRKAQSRPNLIIRTHALTTRILFEGRRAIGVAYRRGSAEVQVGARREVIVSAGSYGSPQLLLLSGIGPSAHLREMGIATFHELPGVGENLSEHPNVLNSYETHGPIGYTKYLRFDRAVLQVLRWCLFKTGPFATNGSIANIFLRSLPGLDRPDVQLTFLPLSGGTQPWLPGLTPPPLHCFEVRVGVLHPRSRGTVRLRSPNFLDKPRITFNLFKEQADIDTMIRAVQACRKVFASKPLSDLVKREVSPGPAVVTNEEMTEFIRSTAGHRAHPVGTCKMGLNDMAVVDAQLRVRGLEGLRVADASIMPEVPTGNTNLPSIMIGEKASDLIRGRQLAGFVAPAASSKTA